MSYWERKENENEHLMALSNNEHEVTSVSFLWPVSSVIIEYASGKGEKWH